MSLDAELRIKKCVHVTLLSDTHAGLRIMCFKKKLSMQAVLEEICQLVALEDPHMMRVLDGLAKRKREKLHRQLSRPDAETLFDAISRSGALNESEQDVDEG